MLAFLMTMWPGYQVVLVVGAVTEITVSVEAENGDAPTKTYTVMVYRENLVKSDEPRLDGLGWSDIERYWQSALGLCILHIPDGIKSNDVEADERCPLCHRGGVTRGTMVLWRSLHRLIRTL